MVQREYRLKNWIKKPFHVRFIGAALLSMKKTGTFMKIAVMTIARIIGVYIIVFECTGQHAKKQQPNNKSRPKHKKTVNYGEKQNNIKARAGKHSCACISKRFFSPFCSLHSFLPSSFVAEFILVVYTRWECLTFSSQRNWRLQRRQFNKWVNS